jgi:hypothetical protein
MIKIAPGFRGTIGTGALQATNHQRKLSQQGFGARFLSRKDEFFKRKLNFRGQAA